MVESRMVLRLFTDAASAEKNDDAKRWLNQDHGDAVITRPTPSPVLQQTRTEENVLRKEVVTLFWDERGVEGEEEWAISLIPQRCRLSGGNRCEYTQSYDNNQPSSLQFIYNANHCLTAAQHSRQTVMNMKLSYLRDIARWRSLRRSRSFKVTDFNTNRKIVCDFLINIGE